MELTKYKKCTDCGLTLAVNKKNFDYRIRETGKLYINLRCKPCRAIKKKANRYKNIDHYRLQATKRRHSIEYAEGRFDSLGYNGWTHAAENRIRASMSWILGKKDFSNIWEKKFHRIDGLLRSSVTRRKNHPISRQKQKFNNLSVIKKETGISVAFLEMSKKEKAIILGTLLISNASTNYSGKLYHRNHGIWEKKFGKILGQIWEGRNT